LLGVDVPAMVGGVRVAGLLSLAFPADLTPPAPLSLGKRSFLAQSEWAGERGEER